MATTYEEIIGFLNEGEMKFTDLREHGKEGLMLRFVDSEDDEFPEVVAIRLDENGEFIKFFEPQRYKYVQGEHKDEVFQTLLAIQYEAKMLQWEYDPSDGEIRACIEFPLEDAKLTKCQLLRVIKGLVSMMSSYHERIKHVMETGEDTGPVDNRNETVAMLEAMLAQLKSEEGSEVPESI